MKNQRNWFLRVPWGKLALVSYGHPDGEPVFLVHGRQDSSSVFEPIIELMSDEYFYVALDMPGNGLSDAFPHVSNVPLRPGDLHYAVVYDTPPKAKQPFIEFNKFSQALHCKEKRPGGGVKLSRFHFLYAMELALLHLGWDKFIFMGHSMGCEQGLFYNVIYPGQITKMILFDAGPTIMRMQIEDPSEYQRTYYDNYYENYHKENFVRKKFTKQTAIEALRRMRDLTADESSHLLRRNFHSLGDWHPIESWHPNEASLRNAARKPNLRSNVARFSSVPFPRAPTLIEAQIPTVATVNEAQIPSDKTQNAAQIRTVENKNEAQIPLEKTQNEALILSLENPNEAQIPMDVESSDESSSHHVGSPRRLLSPVSRGPQGGNNLAERDLDDKDAPIAGCSKEAIRSVAGSLTGEENALQSGRNEAVSSAQNPIEELGSNEELGAIDLPSNGTQSPMQQDEVTSISSTSTMCEHEHTGPFICCVKLSHEAQNENETLNGIESPPQDESLPLDESPPQDVSLPLDESPTLDKPLPLDESHAQDVSLPLDVSPTLDEPLPLDETPPQDVSLPLDVSPTLDESPPLKEAPPMEESPPQEESWPQGESPPQGELLPQGESPPQGESLTLSEVIDYLREVDEVGYLSWDNRLKTLAPQNYGNDYYFQIFKKIPPTLLIAASDGAKNMPPNPKWRQGAKELLDKMATLDNFHRVDVVGSHDVHYTHPEIVAPYVNKFLKKKVYSKL